MLDKTDDISVSAENWLVQFEAALTDADGGALEELFHPDSYWRDALALSWTLQTINGRDAILKTLKAQAAEAAPSGFVIDPDRAPPRKVMRAGTDCIETIFGFETRTGCGDGILRLVPDAADGNRLKAWTLLTALEELKGFEEQVGVARPRGNAYSRDFRGPNWLDLRNAANAYADRDPTVLVVGGGQSGLSIAARLKQLNVDTLIVDRMPRIGDNWRKRYHALTLHNQVQVNHLPYMLFPPNWPTYIPKDKLANWFESYVDGMELNFWTGTEFEGGTYDEKEGRWSVTLRRAGEQRVMHPRHVVLATGVSGIPNIPDIPGLKNFAGKTVHSSRYDDGENWKGKRALVIGTGNSGHDIAQDLYSSGAGVTMVQRSSTLVVSIEPSAQLVYTPYNEGTLEDNDLIAVSMPLKVARKSHALTCEKSAALDKDLLDGLRADRLQARLRRRQYRLAIQIPDPRRRLLFQCRLLRPAHQGRDRAEAVRRHRHLRGRRREDEERRDRSRRPDRAGHRLSPAGRAGEEAVRRGGHRPRRHDLGFRRNPGAAQHVCAHRPARPLVHRRRARAMPDRLEAARAADQGDRGRVDQITIVFARSEATKQSISTPRSDMDCFASLAMTRLKGETHMKNILGAGEHRYRVVENWAKLPDGWQLTDAASVAVDSKDRIYVFNRGEHPMIVLDRDGNFIRSFGEGLFSRAHGLHIDADDNLYCTDDGDHTVRKCTTDGKVLLTIGIPKKPAPFMSGEPFHRCTHTALSPKGEIYVSDGYGNARVHKYTPDGKLIKSWGESGTDPGQFNIVHNIATDADGWVYVADRENHRVQVFDGNGKYETQWNNLHRPCALCCCGGGKQPNFIIGELGPGMPVNLKAPNLGPRLTIVDSRGNRIARLGGEHGPGLEIGKFLAPHGIALDSKGDIYVGEVGVTNWKTSFPDTPMPEEVRTSRCLQKLEKI